MKFNIHVGEPDWNPGRLVPPLNIWLLNSDPEKVIWLSAHRSDKHTEDFVFCLLLHLE